MRLAYQPRAAEASTQGLYRGGVSVHRVYEWGIQGLCRVSMGHVSCRLNS